MWGRRGEGKGTHAPGRGVHLTFFAAYGPHIPVVCMSYNFWVLTGHNMMYQL